MLCSEKRRLSVCCYRDSFGKKQPVLCSTEIGITPCSVIKSKVSHYTYTTLRPSWLRVSFVSLSQQDAAVAKRWVSLGRWAGGSPIPFFVYPGCGECFHFLQLRLLNKLTLWPPYQVPSGETGRSMWTTGENRLWSLHWISIAVTPIWWNMKLGLAEWIESCSM